MNNHIATSVVRNTTVMMAQQVTTWMSTFVLMLFLPRYLGPAEYGKLYLALSITGIFGMFVSYGGFQPIGKMISRSRESAPSVMVNAIAFRLVISAISIVAMIIFSLIANYSHEIRLLILICGSALLWQGAHTVLYGCFQGFELLPFTSLGSVAERVFVSVVGVCALFLGAQSVTMAIIFTLSTLINFLVLAKFTPRIILHIPKVDWQAAFAQLKEGIPYFLFLVFGSIYYRIDSVMLSLLTPEIVVGWYGAAYKFFDVLNFLPSIFTISIFPVLSKLWLKETESHTRATQKSLAFMLLAAIPISIGMYIFSEKIIQMFYGLPGYQPSIVVLQILCVGLLFLYIDMILGTTLLASDKQKQLSMVALLATPVNIGLNYLLIPYAQTHMGNGGIGSAVATVITEIGVMVAALILMPKGILKSFQFSLPLKGFTAGICMAGSIWLMEQIGITWIIEIVLSPVVYWGGLYILKSFDKSEVEFIRSMLTVRNFKKTFIPEKNTSTS